VGKSGTPDDLRRPVYKEAVEQMFLGKFEHNIDDKGRLTIPPRYRDELGENPVITQGFGRYLLLLKAKTFNEISESISKASITNPRASELRRLLFSNASEIQFDRTGRILLPQFLREENQMDGAVQILGNGSHLEIWPKDAWIEHQTLVKEMKANDEYFTAIELVINPI
jgi:MraZ protein